MKGGGDDSITNRYSTEFHAQCAARHKHLMSLVKSVSTDYEDYGGTVKRWEKEDVAYPDCASNCKHYKPLFDELNEWPDTDWGVCANPKSKRAGLLTFEHQAGFGCYEPGPEKDDI